MMGRWQEVQHTADLSVHVWGDDLADLFETAARAMFVLLADAGATAVSSARLTLTAPDVESLLVDWLSELLYLHEEKQAVFAEVAFEAISRTDLRACVVGFTIGERRSHIKAVTYHMLTVVDRRDGYETEIVFDV